ncbi:MAG: hypothetical protein IPJ07_14565 [Acidobacteria bacterium]|nr:hypothetical protein [Acidobacteriota bacterium]
MHELLLDFRRLPSRSLCPEKGVIGRMKMLSAQFLRGVPNCAHIRTAVLRSSTVGRDGTHFIDYFPRWRKSMASDSNLQSARDENVELVECGVGRERKREYDSTLSNMIQ